MYISLHNHTAIGSNIRGFLDSTNRVEEMVQYAHELGMPGICITDHESTTAHIDLLHHVKGLKKKFPEEWEHFKPICGNEIYLTSKKTIEEDKDYTAFYHFILIAKDLEGHKQIRELSTKAWLDNYFMYVIPRTPTYFEDLFEQLENNPGHLIGSTACLGGQVDRIILEAYNKNPDNPDYTKAKKFINGMKEKFGEGNFFLEMQPSYQNEQVIVNKALLSLSQELNVPYIITTDAHYLKEEDREIHKAFLSSDDNSSNREVDDFYATTYIMSEDEIHSYMDEYLGYDNVQKGLDNTLLIYNACQEYSLDQPLSIPYKSFDDTEPSEELYQKYLDKIPTMRWFKESEFPEDRHLLREILNKMQSSPQEFENEKAYEAIEDCFNTIKILSEKLNNHWSAYLLMIKYVVQTCWDSGSLVGCGRGSSGGFIFAYMLDITQVNPLLEEVKTYAFRFLNPERVSVPDCDIDVIGELRDLIISNLRDAYGGNKRVTQVQTISTAKSKKAIQIACRGLGYTAEEGIFLGSFIKAERGILYTLHQTYYGDEENGILPDKEFASLMDNKYPDVWNVAKRIEGLCCGVGSHAGGVILSVTDLTDNCALMRTRTGTIITQWDLHKAEDAGLIKIDLLAIDAMGKMKTCMKLLMKDGYMQWQGTWKATYEKYLGVYNIDRSSDKIWDAIDQRKILSFFQFEKQSGVTAIQLGQPRNLTDLVVLNSIMRLMSEEGAETPLERYSRLKNDISQWYKEMDDFGLTKEEQKWIEQYMLPYYGNSANQEHFMIVLQDPMVGGHSLLFADRTRKAISKKIAKDFEEIKKEYYDTIEEKHLSYKLCDYVFKRIILPQRGYAFNSSHVLFYSIIGLQEANLAVYYPSVYWQTANLISDSGGEDGTVNYGKIASAVGRLRKEGINIVPPYINEAEFDFKPDAESNKIVYGLKAISGIGSAEANAIVANKPYTSINDFYQKMEDYKSKSPDAKFGGTAVIQLIKAGAFDELESKPREEIMKDFISFLSKPIKKVTSVYIDELANMGMFTQEEMQKEVRYYRFKKYIFQEKNVAFKEGKSASTWYYTLDRKYAEPYFIKEFINEMEEGVNYKYDDNNLLMVKRGKLESVIDKRCEEFYTKITSDPKYLTAINQAKFNELWNNKASGTIASWEMNSMFYYYHDHELAHVNQKRYGLVNFDDLPVEPEITEMRHYRDRDMPRYTLHNILGTVIDKDANHNTVTLLTPGGVVTVRFYKGHFTFYAREIVEKDKETGKKTVLEKSWFKRGTKLFITGTRMGENFVPKVYNDSIYKHSVQLINSVDEKGILTLTTDRINVDKEDADTNAISI